MWETTHLVEVDMTFCRRPETPRAVFRVSGDENDHSFEMGAVVSV
jgi:hypothetical protein